MKIGSTKSRLRVESVYTRTRVRSPSRTRFIIDEPVPIMTFDHERLDVYHASLDFFDLADQVVDDLPRGRGHLGNQLARASLSIVNNIAEGAGKFSSRDKSRFYQIALGSASESAAMLDVCCRRSLISEETHTNGKDLLVRIASMLVKLAKVHRRR